MAKTGLGRGLGALLGGAPSAAPSPAPTATTKPFQTKAPEPVAAPGLRRLTLSQIHPSPLQPRKDFPPESLQELADSIREQGLIQPLVVRAVGTGFELIAGERRWRASQVAGLTEVPVVVREATDREVVELALIENLQRENLNPIEEALGYVQLNTQFQLTQEEIARRVGKSRVVVANAIRLLRLPEPVRDLVRHNRLSVGHAKVLLTLPDIHQQQRLAQRIVDHGLSVRETERIVAEATGVVADPKTTPDKKQPVRDPLVGSIEEKLRERLGTQVHLRHRDGKGALEIRYFSDAELNRILDLLGVSLD
ncbi:MAG: ParB/RepB/Spo0J family partition protein [Verrucomicrobia bacterium]|nr:ParB/RepB/Spo0J family partition protein [Verrucomicrobiota bacterium]